MTLSDRSTSGDFYCSPCNAYRPADCVHVPSVPRPAPKHVLTAKWATIVQSIGERRA